MTTIHGTSGADNLNAGTSSSPVALIGGLCNDTLTGSVYDDSLDGGSGHDYLYGGLGNDTIVSSPTS